VQLATVRTASGRRAARVVGDELVLLPHEDVGVLLADPAWRDVAADGGERIALADADFAPLVPAPEKIVCIGLNYRKHAEEAGLPIPEYPILFAKFARALIGARDPIVLPRASSKVDWEAELAVVIGREARRVSAADAPDVIAGYTVANDISMRDWQRRTPQWLQGKTFEASTPLGPTLVTLDELDDPGDVRLGCQVDGEVMQDSTTGDLIFGVNELVAYVSEIITLAPGDVLLTGTPSGVGGARKPPVFLAPGQTVRTLVDGVGELVNVCVGEEERS
jgi:acylpyruvate hydrolase